MNEYYIINKRLQKKIKLKREIQKEVVTYLENLMKDLYENVPLDITSRIIQLALERHEIIGYETLDSDQVYYAITDVLLAAFEKYAD
jgi:hypothetical protein